MLMEKGGGWVGGVIVLDAADIENPGLFLLLTSLSLTFLQHFGLKKNRIVSRTNQLPIYIFFGKSTLSFTHNTPHFFLLESHSTAYRTPDANCHHAR